MKEEKNTKKIKLKYYKLFKDIKRILIEKFLFFFYKYNINTFNTQLFLYTYTKSIYVYIQTFISITLL